MGLALYLVLWLLMPDEGGEIHVERALKHGEGSSIFLLVVTAIAVSGGGPWWGGDSRGFRFFGFALLVVGAWWFLTRTGTGRELMAQAPWRDRSGSPSPSEGAAGTTSTTSGGWTPPAGDGTATPGEPAHTAAALRLDGERGGQRRGLPRHRADARADGRARTHARRSASPAHCSRWVSPSSRCRLTSVAQGRRLAGQRPRRRCRSRRRRAGPRDPRRGHRRASLGWPALLRGETASSWPPSPRPPRRG